MSGETMYEPVQRTAAALPGSSVDAAKADIAAQAAAGTPNILVHQIFKPYVTVPAGYVWQDYAASVIAANPSYADYAIIQITDAHYKELHGGVDDRNNWASGLIPASSYLAWGGAALLAFMLLRK